MTSPGPDDVSRRLAAAATATGADRPQLAYSLAQSDLSTSEMQSVGGFVKALQLQNSQHLAANSGAKTNYSADEKNQIAGAGGVVTEEDVVNDSRSWLEKATDWIGGAVSNTSNALLHNYATEGLLTGMEWLGNAAHMPFRLLSDAIDPANNDEIDAQMKAQGYDPSSTTSYLSFMFGHGESQYHDLSSVRDTYTDDTVDLALQMQADPEQFQRDFEKMDPAAAADLQAKLQTQEFKDAFDAVDRKHISPGRDIARILTFGHEHNAAFTAISGSLDAAYDWFTDPTLILGKANKIIKAADVLGRDSTMTERFLTSLPGQANRAAGLRAGANSMIDGAGVSHLMRVDPETGVAVTKVGKAWQRYLADAEDLRAADEEGNAAKRAGIFDVMQKRYGTLMDLLPEINGQRVIPDTRAGLRESIDGMTQTHLITRGKPITDMKDLTDLLVSHNGLLRLNTGMAAREAVVMPGRLSWWAENKAAAETRKAASTEKWINYADKDGKFIPNEAEQQLLDAADDPEAVRAGLAQRAQMLKTNPLLKPTIENARAARAKIERVARRFTTQIPNVERMDLGDQASAKTVEQIARMYLNRGDAAKLASAYALAPDIASRRAVLRGVLAQSFHASGLSRSEGGRNFMEKFIGDQSILEKQQYGYEKTSEIVTDRGNVQVALYPDQISRTVILPSMREMNYLATKFAVGGFMGRKGLADARALAQGDQMDAMIGRIKLGWITSAAGGLRNALDEVANFATYGMGKDVLQGRAVFSRVTKDLRAKRLEASKERLDMIRQYGRTAADDRIAERLSQGLKSHEDATLAVERAKPEELNGARADLAAATKELHQAQLLQTAISHRIPYAFRHAADNINDLLIGAALGKAMRMFGKKWVITDDHIKYASELVDRELGVTFRDGVFQANHADTELVTASDAAAMNLHRAGLMARKYSFRSKGWGRIEMDGGAGLSAWSKTLQLRFQDPASPAHAWAQKIHELMPGEGATTADAGAFDRLMGGALQRTWDDAGRQTREVRAVDRDGVLHAQVHDLGPGGTSSEQPVDHIYRVISKSDYERMKRTGMLDTHGRHSHGRYDDPEGLDRPQMFGAIVPSQIVKTFGHDQLDPEHSVLLKIKYRPEDGWYKDMTDGNSSFVATRKPIPFDQVEDAAPFRAHYDEEAEKTSVHGVEVNPRDEMGAAMQAARDAVRSRLDDEDMRHFVNSAEFFQWYKGTRITKGDDETLALAKDDYADRVSADLAQATGREGEVHKPLLDELVAGRVPDASWLADNVDEAARPDHAIGQLWAPYNPAMQPGQLTRGMTGMMVHAYDKVVTDQINALSRNPLVTALYMRARKNTEGYVAHLKAEGFDKNIAEDMGRRIAAQHAETEALKHIDNPYVSSQFSMMSRNYFAFVRAQEDWLRRWGRTIKDNPEVIRKAQLLIHGGESVGFLEVDDQDQLHFVYPGSGLLLGVFGNFFGAVNSPNGARIPMKKELSSQLTFLNPSLDNPVGFSGTPLVSLPLKAIMHFLGPDSAIMKAGLDKAVNGDLGAGRDWWEQMLPSWANRIIGGVLPTEDMGSKYGAAIQSTLANMEAAGQLTDPKYQSPEGKAKLLHALQVGTHNDLLTTALFGFFAPGAPLYEAGAAGNADGFQGNDADWSAHIEGLRSLRDEARQLFARLPYEEAKAWWQAVHPGESVLAPIGTGSRTTVGASAANAASTLAAAHHIEHNDQFYKDYVGTAAYFIPQGKPGSKNGEYSDVAYRAQLELGIRSYKSLSDYFDDIVTSRGMSAYFAAKDEYDAQRARVASSPSLAKQVDAEWQDARDLLMKGNPLLGQRLATYASDNAAVDNTIQALYRMAKDTSASTTKAIGPNRAGLVAMLGAKQDFDESIGALGDRRGSAANRRRQEIKTGYDATINQLAAQYPGLADLARGVFRPTS